MSIYRQPVSITEDKPVFDLFFRIKESGRRIKGRWKEIFFCCSQKNYIFGGHFVSNKTRFQLFFSIIYFSLSIRADALKGCGF